MFDGQELMTGLSLIVTVNEQLEELQELVAVHVTVVIPVANVEPEAGEQLTVGAGIPVDVGSIQVAM